MAELRARGQLAGGCGLGQDKTTSGGAVRLLRAARFVTPVAFAAVLGACQEVGPTTGADVGASLPAAAPPIVSQEPATVKYYPSDQPYPLGVQQFNDGNFGLAQHYFQDAVEKAPRDVSAWIGLAASYDRLGRFDLADRAYRSAIRLNGQTVQILNNEGYSYMLRGDLIKARAKFQAALRLSPGNPTIINNLTLLESSAKYIHRTDADAQ
jgi:Flp pilus assembly protein TadD